MSDLEDIVLLDEIKALEDVLARKIEAEPLSVTACTLSSVSNINSSNSSRENQDCIQYIDEQFDDSVSENVLDNTDIEDIESTDNCQAALNLNKKLVNCLLAAKSELTLILQECKRKQAVIDEKLQKCMGSWSSSKLMICTAGIPYFKDKGLFPAPKNDDTRTKKANGELQIVHLPFISRWTPKDRITLVNAILDEAISTTLYEKETKPSRILPESESHCEVDKNFLSKNFRDTVGPLGEKEFDWLKIAATDFGDKHSAEECRVMWNVFLHPDINKQKWSKAEITKLKSLAQSYNLENWDAIAKDLGTRRTGYQCFIKYNLNNRNIKLRGHPWSVQADQKVVDLVDKLRIGDFIPWGEVASYMDDRTKQQIYFRWMYSLAPHLKKGRFTQEEDKILLDAIAKYGTKFSKISALIMPSRSSVQLNDHYHTLVMKKGKLNYWSIEDDMKLIKLQRQFGQDWSKIAKHFSQKTRVQVRHRYSSILRHSKKGLSLTDIPRMYNNDLSTRETLSFTEFDDEINLLERLQKKENQKKKNLTDIDEQLIEYFKFLPSPGKSGRKRKYYTSDELKDSTQKLFEILRILNANLDIPDNLQIECFSEKDKQLLTSLKEYYKIKANETQCHNEIIESVRLKMFGSKCSSEEGNHFIPPLPFFCSEGKAKKMKQTKSIDFCIDKNQNFLVEIKMELETPSFVISLIGGKEKEFQFQKITGVLLNQKKTFEKQSIVRKVYILSPQTLLQSNHISQIAVQRNNSFVADHQKTNRSLPTNQNSPSTSINFTNEGITKLIRQSDIMNTTAKSLLTHCANQKNCYTVIQPNYSTLLGFQNILSTKKTFYEEDSTDSEYQEDQHKITREGQKAIHLLEKRLLKLFKFPISMSQISPLTAYKSDSIFVIDTESTSMTSLKRKSKGYTMKTSKKVKTANEKENEVSVKNN